MQLPKRIKVCSITYDVKLQQDLPGLDFGAVHWFKHIIAIATHRMGRRRPARHISKTFWHEMVHVILNDMGETDLCWDERFVDNFARRLNDAIRSARL